MAEQPDEMTITLPKPVRGLDGNDVTEVMLRAPTAAEWSKANKLGPVDSDIELVSSVSGLPKQVVERMPAFIVNRGARYMTGFFDPLPQTDDVS